MYKSFSSTFSHAGRSGSQMQVAQPSPSAPRTQAGITQEYPMTSASGCNVQGEGNPQSWTHIGQSFQKTQPATVPHSESKDPALGYSSNEEPYEDDDTMVGSDSEEVDENYSMVSQPSLPFSHHLTFTAYLPDNRL
jgi:hypothetical protein